MKFNSQICTTKEQSERLLALGLKKETADCCLVDDTMGGYDFQPYCVTKMKHILHNMKLCRNVLPAWSLDSLLNLLPINIEWNNNDFDLIIRHAFCYIYHNDTKGIMVSIGNSNRYEGTISLIEWLIKEGYFNNEYLEKI